MIKVACQGACGSFSHLAGLTFFPEPFSLIETTSFQNVFIELSSGNATFGVIPIENSLVGSIYENYDLLCQYDIPIRGEVYLRIEHNLLVIPDNTIQPHERIAQLSRILSHPKALEQCKLLFKEYPNLSPEPCTDTAGAARAVAKSGDLSLGAIASKEAAEFYGLSPLLSSIEDDQQNYTRFLVIGSEPLAHGDPSKISLVVTLEHKPGSLIAVLSALYQGGGDLTKIESRPVRGHPFEYLFYLDIIHPIGASAIREKILPLTRSVKILGEYQAGVLPVHVTK
jgi:prephenate dehydratase